MVGRGNDVPVVGALSLVGRRAGLSPGDARPHRVLGFWISPAKQRLPPEFGGGSDPSTFAAAAAGEKKPATAVRREDIPYIRYVVGERISR